MRLDRCAYIETKLFALQDKAYADFQSKLLPTVKRETVIGVRTPDLRKMAKQICKTPAAQEFLQNLPHRYFDENQLHAFILSEEKDFDRCIAELEHFLPYVDNWATCDQLSPKCFKKHTQELLPLIRKWMKSKHTYTIRLEMGMLMRYYLDGDFRPEYLEWVASIKSDEYYIRMMQAWFFATALAKQWDATLPYIEQHRLHPWTHNKTIQKAIESYRITDEQKALLRTFRVK
ncbi:MAG: DNA alkylation repair protein [Paludibacteraceae bacterium]|nr:DNA alkylation repair protein [Paludibacteraceae bacterium]